VRKVGGVVFCNLTFFNFLNMNVETRILDDTIRTIIDVGKLPTTYGGIIQKALKMTLLPHDFQFTAWNGRNRNTVRLVTEVIGQEKENVSSTYKMYLKPQPFSLEDSFFEPVTTTQTDLSHLLNDLKTDLERIADDDIALKCSVLERYTTMVQAYEKIPDIALYDVIKTTAAYAFCQTVDNSETPYCLFGGDLSGIQAFIYDIVSKNAAKNLKGRSFYLQLIIDSMVLRVREAFNLPSYCVVYASGGTFYMIIPAKYKSEVAALHETLSKELFNDFVTQLSISIACTQPFGEQRLQNKETNLIWRELARGLNEKKQQRFKQQLTDNFDMLFMPSEAGGLRERDAITGEEFTKEEQKEFSEKRPFHRWEKIRFLDRDETEKPVKLRTQQQIELGENLRDADYWVTGKNLPINEIDTFNLMSIKHKFTDRLPKGGEQVKLLNDVEQSAFPFVLYGGNKYPYDSETNKVKSFSDLVKSKSEFKRIAVLRMDVDDLGQRFISGFAPDKCTFARYSTLSRSLDYFFKGYLNTLRDKPKYADNMIIIYSGGDDLFVVGDWQLTVEFAQDTRKALSKWVGASSILTVSGGIEVVNPKFPIMYAAELAGEAEHSAKDHYFEGKQKDSLAFLNTPMRWDTEMEWVCELKNKLLTFIGDNSVSKSILSKIYAHAEAREWQAKFKQTESWRWIMAYDFARYADDLKRKAANERDNSKRETLQEAADFIRGLTKQAYANYVEVNGVQILISKKSSYHFLELLNMAARWAELEYRNN
jgi:CRISPR-associated protein Csm1